MLIIGLTGGIGSGKTTVANIFATLGAGIIDADVIARELSQPDRPGFLAIVNSFGRQILTNANQLDRSKLRELIFNDEKKRIQLERILHPLIVYEIKQRLQGVLNPYSIIVIPLLAETSENLDFLNRICLVDAPDEMRISWAAERDHVSAEKIAAVMGAQASREYRLKLADDIIENNLSLNELKTQVMVLHRKYLQIAAFDAQ